MLGTVFISLSAHHLNVWVITLLGHDDLTMNGKAMSKENLSEPHISLVLQVSKSKEQNKN